MSAKRRLAAILACAALVAAAPAAAQEQKDPNVFEAIGDAIRNLFRGIFGPPIEERKADEKKATPPPPEPPAPQARPEPAPAGAPLPGPPPAGAEYPTGEAELLAAQPGQPTPSNLHQAIARGDFTTALKLIEDGADLEAKDASAGATPLHYAVMRGRLPLIELLIARRADVNSRTRNGTTPLHTAVFYSHMDAAELLLQNGSEVNAKSASGATPLALAQARKNDPLAAMLKRYGAR